MSHAPRIIAGSFRGRRLLVPASGVRPTKDRVKAAVFSALDARGLLIDAVVLDAFAGSGALGIEAVSRGAAHATLVELDRAALVSLRTNVKTIGGPGAPFVVSASDVRTLCRSGRSTFDVVFCDPPYDWAVEDVDALLVDICHAAPGGTVVIERGRRGPGITPPDGWTVMWERSFGDTLVVFIQSVATVDASTVQTESSAI